MNLLAFETVEQYKEMLHDTSFVRIMQKKWPTVGNETMKKYVYSEWQPDAPYVMLLNMYKAKEERDNQWARGFKGKRLCVIDGGDKARYWKPFIDVADIYVKENSYRKTDRKNVRIGCYCPSMKVPFTAKNHKIIWRDKRKLDVFFCGDTHKGRLKRVWKWQAWCKKHGLKAKFGGENEYARWKYLQMMSKSRMCPSFLGYGDRCRREWEAMLCGSLLVQDPRLKEYPFTVMQPEKHFLFQKKWNVDIARAGYDLAQKCWMQSPSVDIRMAALYMFFDIPQLWTYEELEQKEQELL